MIRLFVDGVVAGSTVAGQDTSGGATGDGAGSYDVRSDALADDVYVMQATAEDLAGNIGALSGGLQVVIANQVLILTGPLAATGPVTVDLAADTVQSFPVPGSIVGIRGIPTVNVDAANHGVSTIGTAEDDTISFTPTASNGGRLTRAGSSQLLRMAMLGTLFVDPLGGVDEVSVYGTADPNSVAAAVDTINSVKVGALQGSRPRPRQRSAWASTRATAQTSSTSGSWTLSVSSFSSTAAGRCRTSPTATS